MKISMVFSLLFHVCMLMIGQKAFPTNLSPKHFRIHPVEFMQAETAPIQDSKEAEETPKTDLDNIESQKGIIPEKSEDTISLDTDNEKYVSYAAAIKEMISRNWKYPGEALKNLMEGNVRVLFSLNRQGHLTNIIIIKQSSFDILDKETLRTIRASAPFPPFPEHLSVTRLNIRADFAYRLTARR